MTSLFGGSLGRNGGKRFSSMSALSAAGAGEMGSPKIPPVPDRKGSSGESPRGSMDREHARADAGPASTLKSSSTLSALSIASKTRMLACAHKEVEQASNRKLDSGGVGWKAPMRFRRRRVLHPRSSLQQRSYIPHHRFQRPVFRRRRLSKRLQITFIPSIRCCYSPFAFQFYAISVDERRGCPLPPQSSNSEHSSLTASLDSGQGKKHECPMPNSPPLKDFYPALECSFGFLGRP
ncbi:hypothetical protein BKA70DRAFT_193720 [Coprinopsis sp. MPI-PUGE-AT-0042]|nr:hypothetical protein BKA70DRAFT_193720 [Coprinopsis sp. MPI-PUGE-AT-0042]